MLRVARLPGGSPAHTLELKKETSAEAHRGASEHSDGFRTEAGEMGKTQRRKMFSLVLHQSQLYGRVTTGK